MMELNPKLIFGLDKLFVKDMSVQVQNAPRIFFEPEPPRVEVKLNSASNARGDGEFEVILTVMVTAKIGDKTAYLVEVCQSGIFYIMNLPDEHLEMLLTIACPELLFPYAREVVSDAITRAGFKPFLLQPVNFAALYPQTIKGQTTVY